MALLFAFTLLTYNINTVIIIVSFVINQDTIAKTLCVQREAPKGCNGKCQLRKNLQESQNTNTNDAPFQEGSKLALANNYIKPAEAIHFGLASATISTEIIDITTYKTITKYYDIDLPPPIFG